MTGDASGTVVLWDVTGRKELSRFTIPDAAVHSFSMDGRRALVFQDRKPIRIWEVGTGRELAKTEALRLPRVVALSPNGELLAVGLAEYAVVIWDIGAQRERIRIPVEVPVSALAWSPDGKTIAWGDGGGGIGMAGSRAAEGRVVRSARGETILCMAFSADGRILATGDLRGELRLWSDDLGREPDLIRKEDVPIQFLTCSPDGRWVATSGRRRIHLNSLDGRERSLGLEESPGEITCAGFSPDGGTLMTGGWNGTVLLWKVPPK